MDIFSRIKDDHDRVRSLIKDIQDCDSTATCGSLFQSLHDEVIAHSLVEEKVLYKPLIGSNGAGDKAMEGWNEHHLIDGLIEELTLMRPEAEGWSAKFQVLGELLKHHMQEEEEKLFGKAHKTIDDGQARRLGSEFDRRKGQMMEALAPLSPPGA